ncbi:MAG TPA: hypothetical protein VG125_10475 [Pirellulales bacterium]|jgi:hypothetical protein|nr:hypothetical protein [Pirellulales bacterium]
MTIDKIQLQREQPEQQVAISVHRTISPKINCDARTTRLGYRSGNRSATISAPHDADNSALMPPPVRLRNHSSDTLGPLFTEVVKGTKRESGVKVSLALAAKVKREAAAAPAASSNGTRKAEQIRGVAKSMGRTVRPRDVIAKLAEQGVAVSSAQVSTVLASMGMKRRKRGRRPAVVVKTVASTLMLELFVGCEGHIKGTGPIN